MSGADAEARLNAEIRRHGWPRLLWALELWSKRLPSIRSKAGKPAVLKGILKDLGLHGSVGSRPPPSRYEAADGIRYVGGVGVRDTSEPLAAYAERMRREGKLWN